ncbi:hypothetical protein GCM10025862_30370 [Arsenicicoccus piscis]|uniref:ArsA/GET3 Anion-transporting ATPase-like domain-containing protein n=3 Tax=Arsenicicoccus piscis TaxID=673954 RepID=A0ABQ6HRQ9_9MICO|nr:hypothetical protein GCM10025862_30370 [Arsenicicoccus piscis]
MLDMKRTFDDVVHAHADPQRAAQIIANPFYQSVSSSFAGTQEYMAMEKLGQLRAEADRTGRWDLIVVDTPPSRSALDFLDAPKRLGSFLDGRFVRLLAAPAKVGGRASVKALAGGVAVATKVLDKLLGAQLLRDVQTFVAALDTMFGGFRERADATYALLSEPGTAFLVVAAPERDALREARYFVERLAHDQMPLAGLVLNRVAQPGPIGVDRALGAALQLTDGEESGAAERAAAAALRLQASVGALAARHRAALRGFAAAHPGVPVAVVAAAPTDVHDLEGLRQILR